MTGERQSPEIRFPKVTTGTNADTSPFSRERSGSGSRISHDCFERSGIRAATVRERRAGDRPECPRGAKPAPWDTLVSPRSHYFTETVTLPTLIYTRSEEHTSE